MRRVLGAWKTFYGENPLHLLALLGSFALTGYVVLRLYPDPSAPYILLWFVGAVIAHDLILYPLYALADRGVVLGRWVRRKVARDRVPRVPAVNHVRVPVMGSALLLLVFYPSISREGEPVLLFAAGRGMEQYYETWLLVTAALLLGSALIYAVRLALSVRPDRARATTAGARPSPQPAALPPESPSAGS